MLPVAQDQSQRQLAIVSLTLAGLCAATFLRQFMPGGGPFGYSLAFIPGVLFGGAELPEGVLAIPPPATLVTYMFPHGSWLHLGGNLLFMWVFAGKVEDAMGHGRFAVFAVCCGVLAALVQAAANPASGVPMIGISGAVSGLLGAFLLLHPRAEVKVVVPLFVVLDVVALPAWVVLVAWFGLQLLFKILAPAGAGGIAFEAHVGGFVAGLALTPFFAGLGKMRPLLSAVRISK